MCGIIGIWNVAKAAEIAVMGLHAEQNRARDFAGVVSCDGRHMYRESGRGVARQVFDADTLNQLHGRSALGHIRYATVENDSRRDNTQPIRGIYGNQPIALAHNGNLTNKEELRGLLNHQNMATSMDSEYILALLEERQTGNIEQDLAKLLPLCKGSYELGILLPDRLIAVRDPSGNHPLSIGKLNGGWCIASETCTFPIMEAKWVEDVAAGTIVTITKGGMQTLHFGRKQEERKCVFELLYYGNAASKIFGLHVGSFRQKAGIRLEELFPTLDADVAVVPVPDSAKFFAKGYTANRRSGQLSFAILRNHYVGRTFVAAEQANRDVESARKYLPGAEEIEGRRVVVIDDSIVRLTTLPRIAHMLWELGAREVHAIIATPPIVQPCRYGINMIDKEDVRLAAAEHSVEELRVLSKVDTLRFMPLQDLKSLLPDPENYCFACMPGGEYW